ncbi:MAG: helix-turn-helix domain-containing protein [Acidimicrobiales bacterium]
MSGPARRAGPRRRSLAEEAEQARHLVTQRQAAELVGCSKDTIIRARLAGRFPHAGLDGQTWMVSIADLVAAGLYDPEGPPPPDSTRPRPAEAASRPAGTELARAQARITALEELVARQDEELGFLRQLTVDTLGRRAAS